jgi:hypothetical protein
VRHFSAGVSEKAKRKMWDFFMEGQIHILVSAEAMALGCNDKSIEFCFVFLTTLDPRLLSVLMQWWGCIAHAHGMQGFCFFFVPPWAIRPSALVMPGLARVKGKRKLPETKATTARRAKLHEPLEKLINLRQEDNERETHPVLKYEPNTNIPLSWCISNVCSQVSGCPFLTNNTS